MMNKYFIGFYCKKDKKNIREISYITIDFLYDLLKKTNLIERGYLLNGEKIDLNHDGLKKDESKSILENYLIVETKKDFKNKIVDYQFSDEAGFSFSLFSQSNFEGINITFSLGSFSNFVNNSITVRGLSKDNIIDFNNIKLLCHSIIKKFNPLWGVVTTNTFIHNIADFSIKEYWFGWMTYFSNECKIPEIPTNIVIEKVDELGILLITTTEVFDSENEEHKEKAMKLVELFRKKKIKRI